MNICFLHIIFLTFSQGTPMMCKQYAINWHDVRRRMEDIPIPISWENSKNNSPYIQIFKNHTLQKQNKTK